MQAVFGQNIFSYNTQGPCDFSLLMEECRSIKEFFGDSEACQKLAYCFHYTPTTVDKQAPSLQKRVFFFSIFILYFLSLKNSHSRAGKNPFSLQFQFSHWINHFPNHTHNWLLRKERIKYATVVPSQSYGVQFLSYGTIDIWGQIILRCEGLPHTLQGASQHPLALPTKCL